VPSARFIRQVALEQRKMARVQNFDRQSLDQKFPLNLATGFVFHSILKCCQPYLSEKNRACNHRNVFRRRLRMVWFARGLQI
jgi:hypothetical protein